MPRRTHAHAQARLARLLRLPKFAQRLISNHAVAHQYLQAAAFARIMIAAGMEPTPGLGVTEFDAMIDLIQDALEYKRLSDEEFEHALNVMTPPEYRGTLQ